MEVGYLNVDFVFCRDVLIEGRLGFRSWVESSLLVDLGFLVVRRG